MTSATLDGAELTGAHLYGAVLDGASLEGARLEDSFLTGASLSADLRKAKLNNAVLEGARFQGANLMGADLRYAWLVDANFDGAFLYGTDFRNTGATLGYATLSGAVFNKATTRWPKGFQLKSKCDGQRCVVQSTPAHQTDLTAFRATLARELPQGWKVKDRDPAGISVDARRKEAEFDGEVLPTKTAVNTPEDCVIAFEKNSMERFAWTQPLGKLRQTRFRGLRAIEREYLFRTSSRAGRTGIAADVHYGRGKLCYRIEASTSRELFGTYLSDFRTLFGLLGAAGQPNGRTLDVFPAAE